MTTAEVKAIPIEEVNFVDKESIIKCFPRYVREQFALARVKGITQTVDISPFDMKAPFSSNYLLKDTKLLLEPNKRHCLVGEAGTGKSTLFENMAKGTIKDFPMHLHVHHCQEIELHGHESDSYSVLQTVVRAHTYRNNLLDCDRLIKKRIEEEKDADTLAKLKENAEFIFFQLSKVNSNTAEERASKMLRVLGFDDVAQERPISALSGGLRMRVALCAAFFIEADLLLLDEPTNHLDFPSVLWLENRLRGYSKSFILICHDRELLNNVCTSCILLDCGKIVYYACGFKEFESRRAKEDKKYSEEIDKFMMRNRNVDFSSPAAKEKAEKQKWLETYNARQILLAGKFTFPAATPLKPAEGEVEGKISLINVENVRFSYQEGKLPYIFDTPISFNVTTSTRIGIMGPNGAGKSTFLKLITDKLQPCSGKITRHKTAVVAYFAQHHVLELNLEQTPSEFMRIQFPNVKNDGYLRKHLQKVGIAGAAADTRMKQLSAGQRSCIMFAKITYECPHLLIMDEPTNFLDLDSVDALIAASNSFTGALLLVSHNRGFLQKCARQYLSIVPGQFLLFDELKACEKATYTFIQELEAGAGGGKIGQNALVKKAAPAAGAAGVIGAKPTGPMVLSGGSRLPPPVTIKKKVVEEPVVAGRGGRGGARGGRGGAPARGGARGGRGRGGP